MKLFCHACGKATNQKVIATEKITSVGYDNICWEENHYFVRCAGCDAFTYAIENFSDYDYNQQTEEYDSNWKFYPQGQKKYRVMNEVKCLPSKVRLIYEEIIDSMNTQLPILSGIGLRTLIEAICKDQGIQGKNLKELIDGLDTNGILSKAQADILHSHRFLGNTAAHDVISAQPEELVAALEIAENILRTIYVLPILSQKIKTGKKP